MAKRLTQFAWSASSDRDTDTYTDTDRFTRHVPAHYILFPPVSYS